ncbi:MAG: 50S ribosomal protein L22 [Candidatus Paceibacterota bacterium]
MKATLKNYRQAPRKVRLLADLVRGKSVERALMELSFVSKKAAEPFSKLISSAVANAKEAEGKGEKDLFIKTIRVDEGVTFERFRARARGVAAPIKKRSSHIYVELSEIKNSSEMTSEKNREARSKKQVA